MVSTIDPPLPPPDWLAMILYLQYLFSLSMGLAGFFHLASHGVLSHLYTGIYVGLFTGIVTYLEQWLLNRTLTGLTYTRNQLRTCQWTLVIVLLLCSINVPIVALFSIAYGDAFRGPPGDNAPYCFFCFQYDQNGANIPAVICDAALLLFGIISSVLISASGSYFWILTSAKRLWIIDHIHYTPAVGTSGTL